MADLNEESREVVRTGYDEDLEQHYVEYADGRKVAALSSKGITVKIDVDVSEALTGLKAVTREAREATKAVKELESLDGSTKINLDTGVFHVGDFADNVWGIGDNCSEITTGTIKSDGFTFNPLSYDTIEIDTKDAAYTEYIYDLTDVPTTQLVEELASRDGVFDHGVRRHFESAEITVTNNGRASGVEPYSEKRKIDGPARILAVSPDE